jgi:hypothetical protein
MDVKEQLLENEYFFYDCMRIMKPKSYDYANNDIVFVEIFRQAWELNLTPQQILWILLRKHLTAIKKFIVNKKVESEPIHARLADVANQIALLDILIHKESDLFEDIADYILMHEECEQTESPESCLIEHMEEKCERCEFLQWLVDQQNALILKDTSSESIQKQLDFSHGRSET